MSIASSKRWKLKSGNTMPCWPRKGLRTWNAMNSSADQTSGGCARMGGLGSLSGHVPSQQTVPRKRVCLRVMVQQHDSRGKVLRKHDLQLPDEGNTITMGFQLQSVEAAPDAGENAAGAGHPAASGDRVSSSASSTEEYAPRLQPGFEVSQFLSSIPRIHVYNQWSSDVGASHGRGVLKLLRPGGSSWRDEVRSKQSY